MLANIVPDFIEISDDESDSVHHEGPARGPTSNSVTTPLSNRLAVDPINDDKNQGNGKV